MSENIKQRILCDVEFDDPNALADYHFEPGPQGLGFLCLRGASVVSVAGFCVPYQESPNDFPKTVTPRVEWNDLPESEREFGKVNRAIGPRLHNTPQALAGTAENYQRAGLYVVRLRPD